MFFDWLTVHQDFDYQLPLIGDCAIVVLDTVSGEQLQVKCPSINHEGSYSTNIQIRISGNRLTVSGNPSRFDRLDNLFGLATIDQCIAVYNRILRMYGLPEFTKCTRVWHLSHKGTDRIDSSAMRLLGIDKGRRISCSDGAVITEIHITSNRAVGQGNVDTYIRALSTLPYRNSVPRLHTNGTTVDWLTKAGKGGRLIYPSVYNKGHEIELHSFAKAKKKFGENSDEAKYLFGLINYCNFHGVVRFEQKIKSEFLRRNNCCFYGLFDESVFKDIHADFLNIDSKLQVEAMNFETITAQLIREGICNNTKAANTTTMYAIQWMHGHNFDLSKSQIKTHRARLRKIGIDIALPCDLTKFSLVNVRFARTVEVKALPVPDWYRRPVVNHLKLVA